MGRRPQPRWIERNRWLSGTHHLDIADDADPSSDGSFVHLVQRVGRWLIRIRLHGQRLWIALQPEHIAGASIPQYCGQDSRHGLWPVPQLPTLSLLDDN